MAVGLRLGPLWAKQPGRNAGEALALGIHPHCAQAWREGGYSDDMLLAAACTRLGLPVATHRAALLPQLLGGSGGGACGWGWYCNYLRRQLFVLDTYHEPACKR